MSMQPPGGNDPREPIPLHPEPPLTEADDLQKLRFLAHDGGYSYMAGRLEVSEREWEIVRAWYDACILYADALIGQLVEWLDRRNLLDSTLIILTSDHGENFGEHGMAYHVYCVYDTLLHVPLVISGPKELVPSGMRIPALVSLVDMMPSLAQVTGAPAA